MIGSSSATRTRRRLTPKVYLAGGEPPSPTDAGDAILCVAHLGIQGDGSPAVPFLSAERRGSDGSETV